jgi:hypothetical protein
MAGTRQAGRAADPAPAAGDEHGRLTSEIARIEAGLAALPPKGLSALRSAVDRRLSELREQLAAASRT